MIRLVLEREGDSWVAFFCADSHTGLPGTLAVAAARGSSERAFHDLNEVSDAGPVAGYEALSES